MQSLSRRVEEENRGSPPRGQGGPVFRSLSAGVDRPRRTVHVFVMTSIALHVAVLGMLALHRRAAPQTKEVQVRVALVSPSALAPVAKAPPPASRPAERRTPAKPTQPRPTPRPLLAPQEIVPATQPPAEVPPPDERGDDQAGGGVSGVASGPGEGSGPAIAAAPPSPPPVAKPPAPVFESEVAVRRRRIAGHDPVYPPKAERNGTEGVVVAKVVIGPDGRVNDVILVQTHPAFETSVRDAVAGWRFSPLVVNGKATTVYTIFRFTFKLS
jgi:periplasmic protein TonB